MTASRLHACVLACCLPSTDTSSICTQGACLRQDGYSIAIQLSQHAQSGRTPTPDNSLAICTSVMEDTAGMTRKCSYSNRKQIFLQVAFTTLRRWTDFIDTVCNWGCVQYSPRVNEWTRTQPRSARSHPQPRSARSHLVGPSSLR